MDYDELELYFLGKNLQWRIDGEMVFPTADDLEQFLTRTKEELDNSQDDDVLFFGGRVIVHKEGSHYDVYVHFGDLSDRASGTSDA